jgi:hypothetical protein
MRIVVSLEADRVDACSNAREARRSSPEVFVE